MHRCLKYSNGSVATRKFQNAVPIYVESMGCDWAKRSFADELEFRPMYSVTQELYKTFFWPLQGGYPHT
jgi:hypothetical protein